MTDAASLWCFATRHSTQAMAIVLVKCCNAVARHHSGARRVGLSTSMAALRLLRRTKAIRGETCLALNADRPTASVIIRLIEYSDSCESHQAFIDKYGLNVKLLADTSGELCHSYGVWQEKEKNGEKKMGIVRSTFIINKDGVLHDVIYAVNADGHALEILEKIRQM